MGTNNSVACVVYPLIIGGVIQIVWNIESMQRVVQYVGALSSLQGSRFTRVHHNVLIVRYG